MQQTKPSKLVPEMIKHQSKSMESLTHKNNQAVKTFLSKCTYWMLSKCLLPALWQCDYLSKKRAVRRNWFSVPRKWTGFISTSCPWPQLSHQAHTWAQLLPKKTQVTYPCVEWLGQRFRWLLKAHWCCFNIDHPSFLWPFILLESTVGVCWDQHNSTLSRKHKNGVEFHLEPSTSSLFKSNLRWHSAKNDPFISCVTLLLSSVRLKCFW